MSSVSYISNEIGLWYRPETSPDIAFTGLHSHRTSDGCILCLHMASTDTLGRLDTASAATVDVLPTLDDHTFKSLLALKLDASLPFFALADNVVLLRLRNKPRRNQRTSRQVDGQAALHLTCVLRWSRAG
jgi:hypothetical protein